MLKKVKIGDAVYQVSSDDQYLAAVGAEFEPYMVQLFSALVTPDDVVADIGANIGLTALLFSKMAHKTYAFEPSPSTYRILLENLARNRIDNVYAFNLGLGHKQEKLTITFASGNRSGGYVSDKIRPEAGHVTEEIQIETIDRFFAVEGICPSFIKIDVEGFEMNVVRGATSFLADYRPTVVMEMNHFCLDVLQRITIPDFLDFMRSVFPYLYAVDADNRTVVDLHNADEAYGVMHENVVRQRFPNIVGGFDSGIKVKLSNLVEAANLSVGILARPRISNPKGGIEITQSLSRIAASSQAELRVAVSNKGVDKWHADGNHPVFLSYHWKDSNGDIHIFDGVRTRLLYPEVEPEMNFEQSMTVIAPSQKGVYRLFLSLVQEGVCWFEDRGFQCSELEVDVV